MNLADFAVEQAERYGHRTLAVVDSHPVSYAGLVDGARRVAGGLVEVGIERGDRVAVMMSTRPEFLFAWFGILGAGAIEVPIHDAARGVSIAYILETTTARTLIVDDEHLPFVVDYLDTVDTLEHLIVVGDASDAPAEAVPFAQLTGHAPLEAFVELEPHEASSILFTGGTTGPPKGVVLSHSHNLNIAQSYGELVGYREDDVLYSVFPLFHANAKFMSVLMAMAVGAKLVIDKRFSASRFWEVCREEGVTAFNGMGEMLRILLKQPESELDTQNQVRMVIGAAAGEELITQFEQRFGVAVLDVYGLTETGPVSAMSWDNRRPGATGVPTPWYEVKVFDDNDVEVPPGQAGQLVVRPRRPHVMMERYWNNDAATLGALANLWFHTGDLARVDADGYIWFQERKTDSIRRRGENVSAWEVERVLGDHPDLLEAAVIGVPAELGGQEVMAVVVPRPGTDITPEALLEFCTGKMAHFAVPRYVRFMDKLPRSYAQRVLKPELKAAGVDAPGVWDRESVGFVVSR